MAVERSSPPPADDDAIDLGDDYLSPRSKVAKMLADIDDAPTPSPTRKNLIVDDRPNISRPFMDDSEDEARPAASKEFHGSNENTQPHTHSSGEEDDDEEEGIVRRPQGRAARRMLDLGAPNTAAQNDSDDDLYSATPLKPASERRRREAFERAASGSPSASSHKKGTNLFVSPAKSTLNNSDGEDDLPGPNRLAELVAQKRAERLARESEQQKAKKSRKSNGNHGSEHASSDLPEEAFEGSQEVPADPNVERILSDAARPTRKASKKAMLEMERETQRLARQQALAHQIKVKKKFSTTDLFARFNFRQPNQQPNQNEKNSSSMPSSDGIEASPSAARPKEPFSTPPSSPPTPLDKQRLLVERGALTKMTSVPEDTLAKMKLLREDTLTSFVADGEEEELPEMEGIIMSSLRQRENAKTAAQVSTQEPDSKIARWSKKSAPQTYRDEGSDDDLEVLEPLPKHLQVFDRIKPSKRQETHSNAIHTLRHLSHLGQVDAKPNRPTNAKPSIHPQVLEAQLRKKAREQAFAAQQERIAELKAKGITIQTTEEKEKEAEEFENLLEKARLDAQDLRKAEKAARREANGEGTMEVSDDETEDEDYYDRSDAEDEQEGEDAGKNDLIDDNADESETNEDAEEIAEEEDDDLAESEAEVEAAEDPSVEAQDDKNAHKITRKSRKSHVIEDDDDVDVDVDEDQDELELDDQASPGVIPASANVADEDDDPFAAFGFGAAKSDANAMSATQAFNATMQAPSQDTQEDSYNILQHVPPPSSFIAPPSIPVMASQDLEDSQTQLAAGPQLGESQGIELNWETQPPETPGRGLLRKESDLSETPGWEPTQDPGLPSPWTGRRRGLERVPTLTSAAENDPETQSTVQLRISESPVPDVVSKRGRLQQRKKLAPDDSEDEAEPNVPTQKKDAFKEMKRQRLEDLNANDRTEAKAEMKRMMDDQAEESEDEYAGLGGDDTEMIAPETAEDKAMIDSSYIDVDEHAIAAHHAARQRVAEEEATKKLYKDITTGGLRRRQREAWDLDEDEDDYIARRRQMRLREETRKRKLLLQDENVKDWAEKGKHTKGKDAFLKAIADDDEREAEDAIDLDEEEAAEESTQQSQSQPEVNGAPLQEIGGNKRPAEEDATASRERPPAKQRRTKEVDAAFSRPTSIGQVRESLSFLLDEPDQILVGPSALEEDDSDLEIEDEPTMSGAIHDEDDGDDVAAENARQNDGGFAPNPKSLEDKAMMPPPRLPGHLRRTAAKPAVVDRLSLKRGSSSSTSTDSRSAWSSTGSTASSKAQSLLRRATTSLSSSGANDRGVTTGGGNDRGVTIGGGARVGGNKKSSLAYQARAEERRTIVEASARRRAENTAKIAELRRANSSSMARIGFAGNSFE